MRLSLTGIGMITSVGRNAVASCASIRAGLVRPQDVDYFEVVDPEAQVAAPLAGHPIRGFTEGFFLMARWLRMAGAALDDLRTTSALPDAFDTAFWRQTGLFVVLPPERSDRFETADEKPGVLREAFLPRLRAFTQIPWPEGAFDAVCEGHAGTAAAIRRAMQVLQSRTCQRVIILAVDSYLDPLTLAWLNADRRLKAEDNPVGLAPGEAAACFLVESEASLRQRQAAPLAYVASADVGVEAHALDHDEVNVGVGLAQVWTAALRQGGGPAPFAGDIISDLNGETWRSYELGYAQTRLDGAVGPDANFVFPAASLGDTGAASGAVGVLLAVRSFQRRYARSTHSIILSSSEAGQVGSICLATADASTT